MSCTNPKLIIFRLVNVLIDGHTLREELVNICLKNLQSFYLEYEGEFELENITEQLRMDSVRNGKVTIYDRQQQYCAIVDTVWNYVNLCTKDRDFNLNEEGPLVTIIKAVVYWSLIEGREKISFKPELYHTLRANKHFGIKQILISKCNQLGSIEILQTSLIENFDKRVTEVFDNVISREYHDFDPANAKTFTKFLEMYDLKPESVLFVSAYESELDAANSVGIKCIRVLKPEQLSISKYQTIDQVDKLIFRDPKSQCFITKTVRKSSVIDVPKTGPKAGGSLTKAPSQNSCKMFVNKQKLNSKDLNAKNEF